MSEVKEESLIEKKLRFVNESDYSRKDANWARVIFTDEANARVIVIDKSNSIEKPTTGLTYLVTGYESNHEKFGSQFIAVSCTEFVPKDKANVIRWLASGALPGIGVRDAELIFESFGVDAKERIEKDPAVLMGVKGIAANVLKGAFDVLQLSRGAGVVRSDLLGCGIKPALVEKIVRHFEIDSHDKAKSFLKTLDLDPFILSRVPGVTIDDARLKASRTGANHFDSYAKAVFLDILAPANGHLGYSTSSLEGALSARGVNDGNAQMRALQSLKAENLVSTRNMRNVFGGENDIQTHYFLTSVYEREKKVAMKIKEKLYYHNTPFQALSDSMLKDYMGDGTTTSHKGEKITLEAGQIEAIHRSLTSSLSVITGGPGTGKTTILRGIVDAYARAGLKVVGLAPTGKASERATKSFAGTDVKFSTVHFGLGIKVDGEVPEINEQNPLEADLLVLDESSMLDAEMAARVIEACSAKTSILFVGDVDQLPSVGPGSTLKDLIQSGEVPVSRLSKIQRVVEGSDVLKVISAVQEGKVPSVESSSTVYLVDAKPPVDFVPSRPTDSNTSLEDLYALEKMKAAIVYMMKNRGMTPDDISVYVPTKKGLMGDASLNNLLQPILNPTGRPLNVALLMEDGLRFDVRVGDRVMHVDKNDYTKQLFNGQEGKIVGYENNSLKVKYPHRPDVVAYEKNEWRYLSPAYATTVHKAQGSESACVLTTMLSSCPAPLRERNMVLTAMSRTSNILVSIHNKRVLAEALKNTRSLQRNTLLGDFLKHSDVKPPRQKIDPCAGMKMPVPKTI